MLSHLFSVIIGFSLALIFVTDTFQSNWKSYVVQLQQYNAEQLVKTAENNISKVYSYNKYINLFLISMKNNKKILLLFYFHIHLVNGIQPIY